MQDLNYKAYMTDMSLANYSLHYQVNSKGNKPPKGAKRWIETIDFGGKKKSSEKSKQFTVREFLDNAKKEMGLINSESEVDDVGGITKEKNN